MLCCRVRWIRWQPTTESMDRLHPYRPRVSRETRLLLTTALIAIVALWVLARIRFPDRPAPQNPVQPLLTQLTPRPTFADLASEIASLRPRIEPLLVAAPGGTTGLRIRDGLAVLWLAPGQDNTLPREEALVRRDRASGLSLIRVDEPSSALPPLSSSEPDAPQFFLSGEMSAEGPSLRPVYVASLVSTNSPRWPGAEWQLPSRVDAPPGSFLFNGGGALAGLVVEYGGTRALVPGATILAEVSRLLDRPPTTRAQVGVEVQALTPALTRATGATRGLVVTWVDPRGPASGLLRVGDVVEAANGTSLRTLDDWDVQVARLSPDQTLIVDVRDAAASREVSIVATAAVSHTTPTALGLTLRTVTGQGSEVVRVDPGSVAEKSGLMVGDIITLANTTDVPTPIEVRRAYDDAGGRPLIVGFTRGTSRHMTALER